MTHDILRQMKKHEKWYNMKQSKLIAQHIMRYTIKEMTSNSIPFDKVHSYQFLT